MDTPGNLLQLMEGKNVGTLVSASWQKNYPWFMTNSRNPIKKPWIT
jgi:hypothetical protein